MKNPPSIAWVDVHRARPERRLPLVCDSPHSGTHYPDDFGHALPLAELRRAEDTHVDVLWSHAPAVGATLIAARFPRTYIDANRPLDDLDAGMLAEAWPAPLAPSNKTKLGFGLVWRDVRAGAPIYQRALEVAEVQRRIERCWRPYHAALIDARDAAVRDFGQCWHLNLHSMPSNAYERLGVQSDMPLADVVIGDLDGRACDPEFASVVGEALSTRGYRVALNDPYKGQELVRLMGDPGRNRHSLQVELNRALYMDEATREPSAYFETVRLDLCAVLEDVARYVRDRVGTELL